MLMKTDVWVAQVERHAVIAKNLLAGYTCDKCQYRAEIVKRGEVSTPEVAIIISLMCGKIIARPVAYPDENTCETFNNSIGGHFVIRNWDGTQMNVDIVE